MDRGRKLRKHIFRILEPAALNGVTQCGKSQGYVAVDNGRGLLKTRLFRQIWEIEHRAEGLEPQLVRLIARPGSVGGWSTHRAASRRAGTRLDGAGQGPEGPHLLGVVLVDLETTGDETVGIRLS